MIAFQQDSSAEVRKCVIGFMEEAWYELHWEISGNKICHLFNTENDDYRFVSYQSILTKFFPMHYMYINILK